MAGNNSIQVLRCTSDTRNSSSEVLLNGQPMYETDTNKFYVGDGTTQAKNLTAINADTADSANTADSAIEDNLGQNIADTYIKNLSVSGRTITYTRGDNSTGSITTQDTNTDTQVAQYSTTTSSSYPLLFKYTAGTSSTTSTTGSTRYNNNIYVQPSTGTIHANNFSGNIDAVSFSRSLNSGTEIGTLTINDTDYTLYCESGGSSSDTNYYPTTWTWTSGTSSGPTASLTGVGMDAVSVGSIPAASSTQSGVVTTGAQTFLGIKTFENIPFINTELTFNRNDTAVPTTEWVHDHLPDINSFTSTSSIYPTAIYAPTTMNTDSNYILCGSTTDTPIWAYIGNKIFNSISNLSSSWASSYTGTSFSVRSGYIKFRYTISRDLLISFGISPNSGSSLTINFPASYYSAPFVMTSAGGITASLYVPVAPTDVTTTNFTTNTNQPLMWIAIGLCNE